MMLFRIQALIVLLSFGHALRQSRQRRILKHSHRMLPEDGTPWGMPGGGTGEDPPAKHAVPPNGKGGKGKGKGGKGSGPPGGSSTTTPAPGDSIDDGPKPTKPTKPTPPGSTEGGPGSTEGGPGSTEGTPEPTDPMDPWQPSSTESGSTEPTESGPTESTSTQSGPTESTSTESGPTSTESTSTQSGPTESTSTESGPTDSTSTESGPTESTSTESGPTDAGEGGPDPTDGTDTKPDPTAPAEGEPAFETQGSVEEEGGLVSTCRVKPPESAPSPVTTTAKFEYLAMLTPGAELQPVLNGVEEGTHRALATHLLVCEYSARRMLQDTNFNYVTVKSTPRDELNMDKFCEDPPDGVDCYVINGGITVDHAPGEPESAVLDDIGGILSAYYDGGVLSVPNQYLERLVFVSFTDETTIGIDTTAGDSPNGDTPAGFEDDGNTTRSASRGTKAGAVAVAVAGVGLIIVGILILRRRRSGPRSVYLPDEVDVEDKDILLTGSDADSSTSPSSAAPPKATVLNDELDDESSYIHDDRPYDLSQYDQEATSHDPLTCDSMTCPICRERALSQNPVFVNTDLTASTYEYPREPSPEDSERSYVLPNTVEL